MIGHGLAFSFAEALPQTPDDLGGAAQRRRQAEVARLVSEGLANKEVARQLGLAEGTMNFTCISFSKKLASQIASN